MMLKAWRSGRGTRRANASPQAAVSLDGWAQHRKPAFRAAMLHQPAQQLSDTAGARKMQAVNSKLLAQCRSRW